MFLDVGRSAKKIVIQCTYITIHDALAVQLSQGKKSRENFATKSFSCHHIQDGDSVEMHTIGTSVPDKFLGLVIFRVLI
jgi:hypothetical protein